MSLAVNAHKIEWHLINQKRAQQLVAQTIKSMHRPPGPLTTKENRVCQELPITFFIDYITHI